jgi:hypothetical protein
MRIAAVLATLISLVVSLTMIFTIVGAEAAPPTVVPSPGYDARLQEQRRAERMLPPPAIAPPPAVAPTLRSHRKRIHPRH